ncbi:MAG: oligosaccharide flippase family protein [Patescibacteria group bacterium]
MSTHSYKKNSFISLGFLFFQSGYSAVLGLAANIIITILAAKDVFGIYSTTLATISIFNYISDIGLAGALIQKKEIKENDLSTVFTVQQSIIGTLVVIGFFAATWVLKFYNLTGNAIYLYYAMLVSFFISSLKTIPSVKLERSVNFKEIVKVQIVENTLFYVVVSICIILHLNLFSFAIALLTRSIVGTLLIYRLSPWTPKLHIDMSSLRDLLSFGVPFQLNSFLALAKDDLMVIFLGKTLGFQSLGEIMWAKKWAEAPIRIIMDNVTKILFPLVSRLQDEKETLRKTVVSTVWIQFLILAPTLAFAAFAMPYVVKYIPKYSKWESALPLFYIFCIAALFSTLSTPLLNVFNALKKPKIPLMFMIIWTTTTWILTPIFTANFGPIGFAYTQIILSSTFILILILTKTQLGIEIFDFNIPYNTLKETYKQILNKIRR